MRILVCGSRDYADNRRLFETLDYFRANSDAKSIEIIEGCAPGADSAASDWATSRGQAVHHYPADWDRHGKAAGPIRNRQMLEEGKPDTVIAFFTDRNNPSRGTSHMVNIARAAGVPTVIA